MVARDRCPICSRPLLEAEQAHRPFCSSRCKLIDLGSWLDGAYRIKRPLEEEDLDESPRLDPRIASRED